MDNTIQSGNKKLRKSGSFSSFDMYKHEFRKDKDSSSIELDKEDAAKNIEKYRKDLESVNEKEKKIESDQTKLEKEKEAINEYDKEKQNKKNIRTEMEKLKKEQVSYQKQYEAALEKKGNHQEELRWTLKRQSTISEKMKELERVLKDMGDLKDKVDYLDDIQNKDDQLINLNREKQKRIDLSEQLKTIQPDELETPSEDLSGIKNLVLKNSENSVKIEKANETLMISEKEFDKLKMKKDEHGILLRLADIKAIREEMTTALGTEDLDFIDEEEFRGTENIKGSKDFISKEKLLDDSVEKYKKEIKKWDNEYDAIREKRIELVNMEKAELYEGEEALRSAVEAVRSLFDQKKIEAQQINSFQQQRKEAWEKFKLRMQQYGYESSTRYGGVENFVEAHSLYRLAQIRLKLEKEVNQLQEQKQSISEAKDKKEKKSNITSINESIHEKTREIAENKSKFDESYRKIEAALEFNKNNPEIEDYSKYKGHFTKFSEKEALAEELKPFYSSLIKTSRKVYEKVAKLYLPTIEALIEYKAKEVDRNAEAFLDTLKDINVSMLQSTQSSIEEVISLKKEAIKKNFNELRERISSKLGNDKLNIKEILKVNNLSDYIKEMRKLQQSKGNELETATRKVSDLMNQVEEVDKKAQDFSTRYEAKKSEVEKRQEQLKNATNQMVELEDKIKIYQAEWATKTEWKKQDGSLDDLETRLKKNQEALKKIPEERQELKLIRKEYHSKAVDTKAAVDTETTEKGELVDTETTEKGELDELEKKQKELESDLERINRDLQRMKKSLEWNKDLEDEDLKQINEGLEDEDLKQINEGLKQINEDLEEKRKSLQISLKDLENKKKINTEMKEHNRSMVEKLGKIETLRKEVEKVDKSLQQKEIEMNHIFGELHEKQRQKGDLELRKTELQKIMEVRKNLVENGNSETTELLAQMNNLVETMKVLREQDIGVFEENDLLAGSVVGMLNRNSSRNKELIDGLSQRASGLGDAYVLRHEEKEISERMILRYQGEYQTIEEKIQSAQEFIDAKGKERNTLKQEISKNNNKLLENAKGISEINKEVLGHTKQQQELKKQLYSNPDNTTTPRAQFEKNLNELLAVVEKKEEKRERAKEIKEEKEKELRKIKNKIDIIKLSDPFSKESFTNYAMKAIGKLIVEKSQGDSYTVIFRDDPTRR